MAVKESKYERILEALYSNDEEMRALNIIVVGTFDKYNFSFF